MSQLLGGRALVILPQMGRRLYAVALPGLLGLASAACVPAKEYGPSDEGCPKKDWENDCCSACKQGDFCITGIGSTTPAPVLSCPEEAPEPNSKCVLHSTLDDQLTCKYNKYCTKGTPPGQDVGRGRGRRRASLSEDFVGCLWINHSDCVDGSWQVMMAGVGPGYESCAKVCGSRRALLFAAPLPLNEEEAKEETVADRCGC